MRHPGFSVREPKASVTTQTSNSCSNNSKAVCNKQTCASHPATTKVLRSAEAGAAGFCKCLGKLLALPEACLGGGRNRSARPSATALKCILVSVVTQAFQLCIIGAKTIRVLLGSPDRQTQQIGCLGKADSVGQGTCTFVDHRHEFGLVINEYQLGFAFQSA